MNSSHTSALILATALSFIILLIAFSVGRKTSTTSKAGEGGKITSPSRRSQEGGSEREGYDDMVLQNVKIEIARIHPEIYNYKMYPLDKCQPKDSYTEDKKRIFVCMRDASGKYYNINKIKQIIIHELAHASSKTYDPEHTSVEFLTYYRDLMTRAQQQGIIDTSQLYDQLYPGQ